MRARRRDRKSFIDHGDPQGPAVAGEGLVHEKRGASLPAGDGFPVFAFVTAKTDPGPERLLTQCVLVIIFALVAFFFRREGLGRE